jgi:hypothetical protein
VNRLLAALALGFCLLLVAGATACSSDTTTPAAMYSANDATKLSAQDLFAAYGKHKKAANELYKGKLLEVAGIISEVGTDPVTEAPEVMLSSGGKDATRGVDCIFDKQYASEVAKLKKGQTVAVLGICSGYAQKVLVLLLHCQPGVTPTP